MKGTVDIFDGLDIVLGLQFYGLLDVGQFHAGDLEDVLVLELSDGRKGIKLGLNLVQGLFCHAGIRLGHGKQGLFGVHQVREIKDLSLQVLDVLVSTANTFLKSLIGFPLVRLVLFQVFDHLFLLRIGLANKLLVILTTNSLNMAKFFSMLNDNEKARRFTQLKDTLHFTCQHFRLECRTPTKVSPTPERCETRWRNIG